MKDLYAKLARAPHAYARLGVHAGCTVVELKAAHRTLAAMLHPDRNPDATAATLMALINVDYECLLRDREGPRKALRAGGGAACAACGGKGFLERGRGFRGDTVRRRCAACAGAGVLA